MDRYLADLHIHSRHSRATSKALTPRRLAAWAEIKGISLLGTGDFTHPEWLAELREATVEDDTGLLRLKSKAGLEREVDWLAGHPFRGSARFMLQAEISSIYKRGGKVRKVHNLVFVPSLEVAEKLNAKLDAIGNLKSDGRPILGLDSRDLLEMVLEIDPRAFLVPAHIWTPWFSLFGSKSGFDTVDECFGDLSSEIFAMETGLSSDPDMNWSWSHLDRFRLISNSDAHSGEKLGREANLFSGEVSYDGVLRALKGKGLSSRFLGTVEFFPEEGKYHLDGHRNCGVVLEPRETRSRGGKCPVCGKPLTVGVLSRVLELADRGEPQKPVSQPGFTSLIPLAEILSEILGKGPATKTVMEAYARVVARVGSELGALMDVPPAELERVQPLLGEAVERMRNGKVIRQSGFDGQFGVIRVFSDAERRELTKGGQLVKAPAKRRKKTAATEPEAAPEPENEISIAPNPDQEAAVTAGPGPVLVLAGPGTGKTFTLMARVRKLLQDGADPATVLAVTFTRRAAAELRTRLQALLPGEEAALPRADTLHALAYDVWQKAWGEAPTILDEASAKKLFAEVNPEFTGAKLSQAWKDIGLARERIRSSPEAANPSELPPELAKPLHAFAKTKESWNLVDYTDLLVFWLEQIEAGIYVSPYAHVLVDEVQDLTPLQLTVVTALSGSGGQGFFAIGDPEQSIYGFRGAEADARAALENRWPELKVIALSRNYRSAQGVLDLSAPLASDGRKLEAARDLQAEAMLFTAPTAASEASWIAERVRSLLGSTSSTLAGDADTLAPGDIAVLVRFASLAEPIRRTLDRLGLPASVPEAEGFWNEPRVARILDAAGRMLGMAHGDATDDDLALPDKILAKGPLSLSAYLQDIPPFDRFFWSSRPFKDMTKAFDAHGGWTGLLNHVHLMSAAELVKAKAETVQIMTLHAAKGLEFEAVFLPALEHGVLPFFGPDFLSGKATVNVNEDEERRLFYVGLTRAKSRIYMSHASRRTLYGRELRLPPSRLLDKLPAGLIKRTQLVSRTKRQEEQLNLLSPAAPDQDDA